MHLLSALSSTTSPLAMQAMPLVGPPTDDFAALIAGMTPAGDAGGMTVPAGRQGTAPTGNPLPVTLAAPVTAVAPVDAVAAIAPPLPVSATEAVLMLPQEAAAPTAPPIEQIAPVLAVMGTLAAVLPEEKTLDTPPRTEDLAMRTALPVPVPVRFAALPPRTKRAEAAPSDETPRSSDADESDSDLPMEGDALPSPIIVAATIAPQPAEAILIAAPPVVVPDDSAKSAATLVIEDGQVVATAPSATTTAPMRLAKRAGDAPSIPAAPTAAAPSPRSEAAAVVNGSVIPLAPDIVVPAHVVVPPQTDDIAPLVQHPAGASATVPTATPSAVPLQPGSTAPLVAPQAASATIATASTAGMPSVPQRKSAPAAMEQAASPAIPAGSDQATPSVMSSAPPALPSATNATPVAMPSAPSAPTIAAAVRSPVTSVPDVPEEIAAVAIDSSAPAIAFTAAVSDPKPVAVPAAPPLQDAVDVLRDLPVSARPAVLPADSAVPAPAIVESIIRSQPVARPAAAAVAVDAVPTAAISADPAAATPVPVTAPAPRAVQDAPAVERAPIAGEAAAPVVPVAAPLPQPVAVAPPITRIAALPVADDVPAAEAAGPDGVAPTRRRVADAPAPLPQATRVTAAAAPAPMVDTGFVDTDTAAPRARRDDDLSVPTTGPAIAPDAATLRPVAAAGHSAQPALDTRQPQWVEGMIDRIETLREASGTNGSGETRIRLSPDALGDVEVAIRTGDDGKLHVRFNSDNADAGRLLADAQPRLVQMAEARGLKLGGMQVDVGTQQQPSQQSQRQAQDQGSPAPRAPRSATQANIRTTRSDDRIA